MALVILFQRISRMHREPLAARTCRACLSAYQEVLINTLQPLRAITIWPRCCTRKKNCPGRKLQKQALEGILASSIFSSEKLYPGHSTRQQQADRHCGARDG